MALLLLLFGGFWVQVVSLETLNTTTSWPMSTSRGPTASSVSAISEVLNLNSEIPTRPLTRDPTEVDSTGSQISNPPSSTTFTDSEVSHHRTSSGASPGPPVPEPTTSQDVSTEKSSVLPETSNATSDPSVTVAVNSLGYPNGTSETMPFDSLETASVTYELTVVMATTSLETSNKTSAPFVTMATSSLEPSNETSESPVTTATSSLEPSNETSGPPVTMTTSSLGISNVTKGPSVSSPKTSASTTSKSSISISTSTPTKSGSNGRLLVPVLVALLVVTVLLALLLLWRRRQKRRTGVLMLNRGGKRNGVVDAWAGPARVPDEEATNTMAGGAGGSKDAGVTEMEASGQRPTLTTFFSRRKSHQGSLALEELKSGSGPNLKGEEEPLVGREEEAVEAPTSNGPEVGDGSAPSSL
ncbi:Leukosialin [Sciurus carolinensis]|uniref:Leukosialin n=2 Tax=Sciurus carolinensis TaxID=30640 RepID=A0AA41MV17_SCICA|nr:Leukosialin [Sciurus carolinensis]